MSTLPRIRAGAKTIAKLTPSVAGMPREGAMVLNTTDRANDTPSTLRTNKLVSSQGGKVIPVLLGPPNI
jgi:hypothetical protein